MSFHNDDERDGLASLFGGITPQATPPSESGRRRAPTEPDAHLEPQGVAARPPSGATPPPVYTPPPAFTPEPPTFASSSEPPSFPAPAYTPPTYAAPAEPPAAEPTGAFGEPVAPTAAAPAPTPSYDGQPYLPPAYVPPVVPAEPEAASPSFGTPIAEPPVPGFGFPPPAHEPAPASPQPPASPSYDLPTPAAPPSSPYAAPQNPAPPYEAPRNPAAAGQAPDPTPYYPGLAPAPSPYPPTAQYPVGDSYPGVIAPPGASPASTAPERAAAAASEDPAAVAPPPLSEPPSPVDQRRPAEPPPLSGFAALGLEPADPVGPPTVDASQRPALVDPEPLAFGAPPSVAPERPEPPEQPAAAVVPAEAVRPGSTAALRRPPGALLPVENPVLESTDDLARATTLEKIGLGVAVIGGPVGLVLAIVNGIRSVRRRGWLTGLGRISIAIAVLSTIAAGIGGVALWNLRQAQLQHAEVAAASAEFCAAAAEHPEIVEPPLLGWPDPGPTIPESITLMQDWTTRWSELAPVSPEGLRGGLESLATRGAEVVAAVEQTRLVNDAENKRLISGVAASSGVANWHATYCVAP